MVDPAEVSEVIELEPVLDLLAHCYRKMGTYKLPDQLAENARVLLYEHGRLK